MVTDLFSNNICAKLMTFFAPFLVLLGGTIWTLEQHSRQWRGAIRGGVGSIEALKRHDDREFIRGGKEILLGRSVVVRKGSWCGRGAREYVLDAEAAVQGRGGEGWRKPRRKASRRCVHDPGRNVREGDGVLRGRLASLRVAHLHRAALDGW